MSLLVWVITLQGAGREKWDGPREESRTGVIESHTQELINGVF